MVVVVVVVKMVNRTRQASTIGMLLVLLTVPWVAGRFGTAMAGHTSASGSPDPSPGRSPGPPTLLPPAFGGPSSPEDETVAPAILSQLLAYDVGEGDDDGGGGGGGGGGEQGTEGTADEESVVAEDRTFVEQGGTGEEEKPEQDQEQEYGREDDQLLDFDQEEADRLAEEEVEVEEEHGHGGGGEHQGRFDFPGDNPCASAILDYLESSGGEGPGAIRRGSPEDGTDLHIDVRHELFDTQTGIVPGLLYQVEVWRSSTAEIRDFYIESIKGQAGQGGHGFRSAEVPIGRFDIVSEGSYKRAADYHRPLLDDDASDDEDEDDDDDDTPDSIPRSTWIEDMELDWLQHGHHNGNGKAPARSHHGRLVFGEPEVALDREVVEEGDEGSDEESEATVGRQRQKRLWRLRRDHLRRRRRILKRTMVGVGQRAPSACPDNVWRQNFMVDERMVANWSVPLVPQRIVHDGTPLTSSSNRTASQRQSLQQEHQQQLQQGTLLFFRVLYRTMTSYAVYELIYTVVLLQECHLFLRQSHGLLSSSRLPLGYQDCRVTFPMRPSPAGSPGRADEPPGLVVQLDRLNTPCRNGGYLQFVPAARVLSPASGGTSGTVSSSEPDGLPRPISLCGKLEELAPEERSFHFQNHSNTTLRVHNQPLFSFHYRLVDYCYNVTLRDRDATVRLRPSAAAALDCYFRIHLPYGYRVALQLLTNASVSSVGGNEDDVRHEPITLTPLAEAASGAAESTTEVAGFHCPDPGGGGGGGGGLLVELYEAGFRRWVRCITGNTSTPITRYMLLSTGNHIAIKVSKHPSTMVGNATVTTTTTTTVAPSLVIEYQAHPVAVLTSRCAFGWLAIEQLCIAAIERRLPWQAAEAECNRLGGHLLSIRSSDDQQLIDQLLLHSPGYKDSNAYWIGAADLITEGDFRWNDKFPFGYTNWFPGWAHQEHYNRQPNDDGLSGQDCVEIRRHFQGAATGGGPSPIGSGSADTLTSSYMWNDRSCDAHNYFLCERRIEQEPVERLVNEAECNVTVTLSAERSKATVWSPGFPQLYPDSVDCYTFILAPPGYRVVLDFEEMVLENEPFCSYDFLQLVEPPDSRTAGLIKSTGTVQFRSRNSRHSGRYSMQQQQQQQQQRRKTKVTSQGPRGHSNSAGGGTQVDYQHRIHFNVSNVEVLQPNDGRYASSVPLPEPALGTPRRICGDWSSKLKLLRYVTRGPALGLRFVSDYSNNFGGYKAKISMENVTSECQDERIKAYNNSCYLIISYPEVDWTTAQQICRGIGAQLASISTTDEQRFITLNIRNSPDYTPRSLYWVGGELTANGNLEWADGAKLKFEGWLPGQRPEQNKALKMPACLGLQWKVSPTPMISSGLHWTAQRCGAIGGYVCKKPRPTLDEHTVRNQTQTGTEGRLLSPVYPNPYPAQTDYWVRLVAPLGSRIIIQFQRLDLEQQDECLYDYISIQSQPVLGANRSSGEQVAGLRGRYRRPVHFINPGSEIPGSVGGVRIAIAVDIDDSSAMGAATPVTAPVTSSARSGSLLEPARDEAGPSFQPYVRWCGTHDSNMSRFDYISAGNEAFVRFHSDFSINGAGFSATWSAVDVSGCPLQTITSREGTIRNPNYPYFLLDHLDCTYVIQAPYGRRVWLEFVRADLAAEAVLLVDIGDGPFEPFGDESHVNDGVFVSNGERLVVRLQTGATPRGKGFHANFKTLASINEQRFITLANRTTGTLYSLNFPQPLPYDVDYTQHLIAPLGEVILLELYGVGFSQYGCRDTGFIEIYDNYTDSNGTLWHLCEHAPSLVVAAGAAAPNDPPNPPVHTSGGGARLWQHGEPRAAPIYITSYMNTLHIRQRNANGTGIRLNATIRLQADAGYKMKLIANEDEWVESCRPNPCQYGGKCIATPLAGHQRRGICECYGHFTGRFCGLNICELEPCLFGKCELTASSFKCNCQPGYLGQRCDQKQKPCAENPCESRGECFEKNGGFYCRCHAWWEGPRCERRMMHIPYKPLSERMLQEPFWLGLITVFVVLAVIGLVWCAKRHFPEKIEKLLADETQRNRPATFPPHHLNTALREQLQATAAGTVCSSNATTPASHRTIFGRLGIRKPSILSLSSPQQVGGATARTFSLDDLLRPPPRRTPSPRKKRNNSTPTKKNVNEKKQILQQLVSPAQNAATKVSLGELIQLSEHRLKANYGEAGEPHGSTKETTFSDHSLSVASMVRQISDPKLEKKVTFARLLSKVSAEMSSGSEDLANGTKHSSALSLPNEVPQRANSVPPSPCTNETRSPHSTSSNQGSDSLSSSELALHDFGLRASNRQRSRAKVSSADSILAMFKSFAASSGPLGALPSSIVISPSSTPTASSPQDDVPGDDDSSTSSNQTPVSYSSGAGGAGGGGGGAAAGVGPNDSPVFYRQSTIEVPVLDALSAHKSSSGSGSGHGLPQSSSSGSNSSGSGSGSGSGGSSGSCGSAGVQLPTILLEIPSNGINNKCLSPIREMPTPIPSPALTPIMPRPQRMRTPQSIHDESMSVTFNSSYGEYHKPHHISIEIRPPPPESSACESAASNPYAIPSAGPVVSIDVHPPTPEHRSPERPRDLIIPELIVQHPSPTRERTRVVMFPGSPPPQRALSHATTDLYDASPASAAADSATTSDQSTFLPLLPKRDRFLKQWEKPSSLDLPFEPPIITITSNSSDLMSSDADLQSPGPSAASMAAAAAAAGHRSYLGPPGTSAGGSGGGGNSMCYLSPFSMCGRGDRAPSESNLSSSGYSSMASPGPSRCGSSNPLFPSNESDDPGTGPAGSSYAGFHSLLSRSRQAAAGATGSSSSSTSQRRKSENIGLGGSAAGGSQSAATVCAAADCGYLGHQSFRRRSDSETDEPLLESNDEGIGTDHLDEKIEEGEIRSAKELELYLGKELIQIGQDLLAGQDHHQQQQQQQQHQFLTMAQLQLPSIVIQSETGCDKPSPVSSRSESPLSERNASLDRFSTAFYGRKDQQLPFTDSDGLYDFPSSDGKGSCTGTATSTGGGGGGGGSGGGGGGGCGTVTLAHRKCAAGRRKERRGVVRSSSMLSPSKSTSSTPLLELSRDRTVSSGAPQQLGVAGPTVARKSPKRRQQRTAPVASSSSSTESLTSMREYVLRPTAKAGQTSIQQAITVTSYLVPTRDSGDDTDELRSSLQHTIQDISSQILPKASAAEDVPRAPAVRKIRRLKAIGNQIRFLRRLERSIHRKEQQEPSDEESCCNGGTGTKLAEGLAGTTSPLIKFKQSQIDEEDEPDEEEEEEGKGPGAGYCISVPSKSLCLPSTSGGLVTGPVRPHSKISRQRRIPSHDCHSGAKPWSEAERKLLEHDVENSD
ncbi:uncharacterized protein LOC126579711 [Anopheles aquasalis]|nr:uncharacterized protein LOC126579711 [Anopheles aquasalis]